MTDHLPTPKSERLPLTAFFWLYIAQSVPMSFLSTALQVIMREHEFSLTTIGLLQLVKLPWILKFLWAPQVDRHCRSRRQFRHFILGSEITYALALLATAWLDVATQFYAVFALVLLALTASATQDIATDALAAITFRNTDKSRVNSIQSMGNFVGTLVGGGLLLMILHYYGWQLVLVCLAIFVVAASAPMLTTRRLPEIEADQRPRARTADLLSFFRQPGIAPHVAYLIVCYAAIIGLLAVLRPWLVDLGYVLREIGLLSGIVGTGAAALAAYLGTPLVRRAGLRRAMMVTAILPCVAVAYFAVLASGALAACSGWWPNALLTVGVVVLWGAYGAASMVVYTAAMRRVRPGREGTDFTLQTVVTHLAGMVVAIVASRLADALGYAALFVLLLALAVATLVYVVLAMHPAPETPTSSNPEA
ncbi:MAG: MFS transporter [Bacteroidaceae bacterium]|nr:MFS transporter [Bacteroidaceae bacterium]